MRYWLTTHYRHPWWLPFNLFVHDTHRELFTGVSIGDRVFFFELAKQVRYEGEPSAVVGERAIVAHAIVSSRLVPRDSSLKRPHAAGSEPDNRDWEIVCTDIDCSHRVPFEHVKDYLDLKEDDNLRRTGGIISLTRAQYERLHQHFCGTNR